MSKASLSAKDDLPIGPKIRFKRFFKIMLEGCSREYCFCKYCRKNPCKTLRFALSQASNRATKSEVTVKAMEYSSKDIWVCEEIQIPKSLQMSEIQAFSREQGNKKPYFQIFSQRASELFSSYEALNISFLASGDFSQKITDTDSRIDFPSLKKFYELVEESQSQSPFQKEDLYSTLRRNCVRSFTSSNEEQKTIFESFYELNKQGRLKEPGQVRFLLLILEIPRIFDCNFNSIFLATIKICLGLEAPFKMALINWVSRYSKDSFLALLQGVKNQIISQIMANTNDLSYLRNVIMLSKLLYEANKISNIVSHQEFYIELISEEQDPREECILWLENKSEDEFSFIEYPWLLECSFKAKILEEESKYEMDKEIKLDLVNMIESGMTLPIDHIFILNHVYFKMTVRRDNIIEDALTQLSRTDINYKKPLKIKFSGEQGVDEGGVKKEFFQLLSKQLMNPDFGMFTSQEVLIFPLHFNEQDEHYLLFNPNSFEAPLNFELCGMLLGLAIYNIVNLDLRFPTVIYKKLLDEPVGLRDIAQFDKKLSQGLQHILDYEGDLENELYMTFRIETDVFGEKQIYDLKPDGDKIFVNQENKQEYVRLYVDWYLNKSIDPQFRPFYRGFHKVVTGEAIHLFNGEELQDLICGSSHLDFHELEKVTIYEDGYDKESQTIKSFWSVVHEFGLEEKQKLLKFCTGSDRAPIKGLRNMIFIISRFGPDSEILPSAHTCFNHLLLPEYSNREKLKEKLLTAIANFEGFGLF